MSKILSIDEYKTWNADGYPDKWEGIAVTTATHTWFVRIEAGQSCCETFGSVYLNDEDSYYFVGSDLIDVEVVDMALNTKKLAEHEITDYAETMFVNFTTSKGIMQLVVYNEHNGYYGHDAQVGRTTAEDTTIIHVETL
jgi:hypothetical protein